MRSFEENYVVAATLATGAHFGEMGLLARDGRGGLTALSK
jgi:hypothetical protein